MSELYSRRNSIFQTSKICGILSHNRFIHIRWFACNCILLVTLMSFNFGMLISPQIYSNFFLVLLQESNNTVKNHQSNSFLFDLIVSSLIQIVLMLVATISGLILLYSASKVVSTLRKRFQLSVKYRVHMSNQTPYPWFFITYERIVYETLGSFFARLLSLILTIYLFGISSIYVLILSDYLDMLFSLFSYYDISQMFCQQHSWFLQHDLVISVWLTMVVLLVFGMNSFRTHNKHSYSISHLKKITLFMGFISVIYITFMVIFIFESNNQSSQNLFKNKQIYSASYSSTKSCLKSNWSSILECFNKNWILLISSVPVLIMPFHLNELLITLLFASHQKKAHFTKNLSSNQTLPGVISGATSGNVITDIQRTDRFVEIYPTISNTQELRNRLFQETNDLRGENYTMLNDEGNITSPLLNEPNSNNRFSSLSGLLNKSSLSFGSLRNLYLFVAFIVCLLNIIVNIFVYISAFNEIDSEESQMTPRRSSFVYQSRFAKSENILLFDLNFLPHYLHILLYESKVQSWQRYLIIIASVFMLLKTTLTYLLLIFRGLLANQTLTSNTKLNNNLNKNRIGCCLKSFLFASPFLIWNFLVLLFSLFLEHFSDLLQYVILIVGWLGCFLVFVYPALVLLYFSVKSMRTNSQALSSSYTILAVAVKPLRWPKLSLLLSLLLLGLGLFYLIFWMYAFFQASSTSLMSIVPIITHHNSSFLYCPR